MANNSDSDGVDLRAYYRARSEFVARLVGAGLGPGVIARLTGWNRGICARLVMRAGGVGRENLKPERIALIEAMAGKSDREIGEAMAQISGKPWKPSAVRAFRSRYGLNSCRR